jgi:hypothetical protein
MLKQVDILLDIPQFPPLIPVGAAIELPYDTGWVQWIAALNLQKASMYETRPRRTS